MIALDPDVRTFMTGYDPSGIAVEWGKNDIGQLSHVCDKLQVNAIVFMKKTLLAILINLFI